MNVSYLLKWLFSDLLYNKVQSIFKRHCESAFFLLYKMTTMIYLKTRIDSLERGPTIKIANHALRWCRDNLGVNNRKKYLPSWNITKGYDPDLVGEYDHEMNEVLIYYGGIDNVKELLQTCIHEWTHQLQPITTKYFKYPGSYSRNPYERQAKYNESKYYTQCWNSIKHKVNTKRKK